MELLKVIEENKKVAKINKSRGDKEKTGNKNSKCNRKENNGKDEKKFKNKCYVHPYGNHDREDYYQNPKSKNYKGNKSKDNNEGNESNFIQK